MDKKAIAEKLRSLACDDKLRSKAARFRDVFDDVEQTLAAGVSRMTVLETLSNLGLDYTLKGFDSALRRNRLKRNRSAVLSSTSTATAPVPSFSAAARVVEPVGTSNNSSSHNPADLDKIIASKPDLAALAKLAKRKTP